MNEFAFKYKYGIVSIVQQNLPCKIYMKTSIFLFMNEFAFEYEYNCKFCSANFPTKTYIG